MLSVRADMLKGQSAGILSIRDSLSLIYDAARALAVLLTVMSCSAHFYAGIYSSSCNTHINEN